MKILLLLALIGMGLVVTSVKAADIKDVDTCVAKMVKEDDVSGQWAFEECIEQFESNGENVKHINYSDMNEESTQDY